MKKYFLKSFALLAMLFSAITMSAASGVDWSSLTWVGASSDKYKVSTADGLNVINVQHPGFASESGIYVEAPSAISACSVNGAIQGAGVVMYLSSFELKETKVTITHAQGTITFWVYYEDGIDWSSLTWVGASSDKYKVSTADGLNVINVQHPGFASESGIYVEAPSAISACSVNGAVQGAGVVMYLSSFIYQETKVTITHAQGVITFWVYYADGIEGQDLGSNEEDESGWGSVNWVTGSNNKYKVFHDCLKEVVSVQKPEFAEETGIYVTTNGAIESCSVDGAIQGGGMVLYLSSFTAKETEVTINYAGGSCTFWVYYADGTEGGGETPSTPTEIYDVNFALASNGSSAEATTGNAAAAIDNNIEGDSRWESAQEDPQTWTLDLGQARIFNTLEIVWEGAYGKTFTVSVSDDKETWTPVWTVEGQQLAGFPYTQTQTIDKTTARYIQFHGTERGTQYGYSFWEFRVFLLGETTLTTLEATPATQYMHMGEENVITITAKDQIGKVMENAGEVTYTISPIEAGVINGNVFTPSQNGTATIVAAIGDVKSAPFDIITYVSQLASLEAKPTNGLAKVGDGLAINVTAKDQHGQVMADAGEVTYTITPADAGTITNGVYTPAKIGLATIVAAIGEVKAAAFEVFAYDGENLALNKSATAGHLNEQAYLSNDNNMGTRWGSNGASHPDNDWWYVDLGNAYDIYAVAIMWETARPANYVLEASETAADDSWLPIKTITDVLPVISPKYEVYVDLTVHPCRYMRVRATSTVGGYDNLAYGISMFDVQVFGTESASLTKTVSASVNDAAMGTATVTQNGEAVTEVTTGSEVTFTAIANEGYVFVNWSNGNTNPSFTTTVDAAMNLTANFRALGTVYCNTPMTVDGHTIYVTMKRSAPETYQLIVRSEENLTNFGGTNFYRPNNKHVINLRDQGVLSDDKHILTATFSAETIPYMVDPLFVIFEGNVEKRYPKLDNIEYDVECSEDVTVTELALNPATVSIVLGDAQTLKPIFTPAHAFGNELEWSSSDETIVTVDTNGVVTAVAEGEAMITAKLVSNPAISATCKITVEPITVKTWWGGFKTFTVNSQEYNVLYSFTRNEDRTITYSVLFDKDASAIGVKEVNVAGVNHGLIYDNAHKTASWTSTTTHSSGEVITGYFYFGIVFDFNFSYIVGSSNERPTITVESVTLDKTSCELMPTETAQLIATVNPGYVANKAVTWSSSADDVATVDANGLVTAKSAGTATITATSVADNTKTATCTVNVMAELTDVTYHASTSVKKDANAYLGINYSITRTSNRTLRYVVKVNNSEYVDLEFNVVVDGIWKRMEYNASANTYTYTTITTYADGDVVSGFFRQIKYGTEGRWDFNYVVGYTSTTTPRTMVAFNDEDVDLSHLNNGSVYDVILKRNLVMDRDWNTLCLPFALTEEQVVDIFGEGTTLVKLEESKLSSATEINLVFVPVTYIEASTPYLIKPVKNVDAGVTLEGVVINLTPNVIETDDANMIPVLKAQSFTGENNTFYLGANENLYPRPTSREIKAMRAYFQFPNLTAAQASKLRARVVVEENVETALDNVSGQKQENIKVISNGQLIIIRNGEMYNAQGIKL